MAFNKKEDICSLLKGLETGDPTSAVVVNEENISNIILKRMKEVKG